MSTAAAMYRQTVGAEIFKVRAVGDLVALVRPPESRLGLQGVERSRAASDAALGSRLGQPGLRAALVHPAHDPGEHGKELHHHFAHVGRRVDAVGEGADVNALLAQLRRQPRLALAARSQSLAFLPTFCRWGGGCDSLTWRNRPQLGFARIRTAPDDPISETRDAGPRQGAQAA